MTEGEFCVDSLQAEEDREMIDALERTPLELVAIAAWANVDPENLPPEMKSHLCPHTMAGWKRVVEAITSHNFALSALVERVTKEIS